MIAERIPHLVFRAADEELEAVELHRLLDGLPVRVVTDHVCRCTRPPNLTTGEAHKRTTVEIRCEYR